MIFKLLSGGITAFISALCLLSCDNDSMLEISDENLGKSPVYTEAQLEKLCFGCDIREGVESFATQGYMEYL